MRGLVRFASIALALLVLAPAAVYAQASVTGVVKDTSGAVLPGVTVEASSPALIEKTRSTVTDGSGLYQITQLVPGTYTVTFSLTGFSTYKRDGLELTGSFVASINAELKVGSVAETITVTGETPLVDVQSAAVQKVVTKEVVDAIPTGRLGINLAALQPGIILGAGGSVGGANTNALASQDVGGTAGDTLHRPRDPRRQAGRTAPDDRRPLGRDDDPLRRVAQQLAQLHRDAGDVGQHVRRRRVAGRRRRADQLRAARRRQHVQGPDVLLSGANGAMQGTNYSTGTRDADGACTPVESLYCRGLRRAARRAQVRSTTSIPATAVRSRRTSCGSSLTARWTEAENYVPNDYPNKNFVVGTTPPDAAQHARR